MVGGFDVAEHVEDGSHESTLLPRRRRGHRRPLNQNSLHSSSLGRTTTSPCSSTDSGSCREITSNTTSLTRTARGLSTQPPAKRSLYPHGIPLPTTPIVPTDSTTIFSLPQQRKSEAPTSLPRHITELPLLPKCGWPWVHTHLPISKHHLTGPARTWARERSLPTVPLIVPLLTKRLH